MSTVTDVTEQLETLGRILRETEEELGNMPFFVRPMARRGFASRTGRSFDDWQALVVALKRTLQQGATAAEMRERYPALPTALDQLAENYRSAPDRAARGMGNKEALLKQVRERSSVREQAVRRLLAWLMEGQGMDTL